MLDFRKPQKSWNHCYCTVTYCYTVCCNQQMVSYGFLSVSLIHLFQSLLGIDWTGPEQRTCPDPLSARWRCNQALLTAPKDEKKASEKGMQTAVVVCRNRHLELPIWDPNGTQMNKLNNYYTRKLLGFLGGSIIPIDSRPCWFLHLQSPSIPSNDQGTAKSSVVIHWGMPPIKIFRT